MKDIIKKCIPISILNLLKRVSIFKCMYWYGDFKTWQDAIKKSKGYNSPKVINKVKEALLQVKSGSAVYERDSVLFNAIQYSWPLLSGLLWTAMQKVEPLNVVDFGGSLGSTYFQNKKFLEGKIGTWNIVEQPQFVECGNAFFKDEVLKFHCSIKECYSVSKPSALLFCSVLSYIEKPYKLISECLKYDFDTIIIDRTLFSPTGRTRLCVQVVSPKIYEASYPCWVFNEKEFVEAFQNKYCLIEGFDIPAYSATVPSYYKGFIFKKK